MQTKLVKIPPKSLGLGMYQHDLTETILDEKLNLTSVDAVAEVGVDINTCSAAILEKVPSLTAKMCSKIIQARPIRTRHDLLKIAGLGEKTFINCAGFVRVENGNEPLDNTMVHPESYGVARWLLKQLKWTLTDPDLDFDVKKDEWQAIAEKASEKFEVPTERALAVISHLYTSICNPDPRVNKISVSSATPASGPGCISDCSSLPSNLSTVESIRESILPLRNIIATVRNIVDFGAFVDIGLENDALVHRSKMGGTSLEFLLNGQEIGVDILGVDGSGKISVGLAGLNLPADTRDSKRKVKLDSKKKLASKRQRIAK